MSSFKKSLLLFSLPFLFSWNAYAATPSLIDEPLTNPVPTTGSEPNNLISENSVSTNPEISLYSPLSVANQKTTPSLINTAAERFFYVSTAGSNTGNGSSANPWRSIQYGVSQLRAGDTLYLREGLYQESTTFSYSGLLDAPITIEGIGNVVIDGSSLPSDKSGFVTNGRDYLLFKNLTVNNFRAAISMGPGSYSVTVDGLTADGNDYAVLVESSKKITVRNAFADHSKNAFRVFGTSQDLLFENVQAYNSKDVFSGMNPDYLNGDGFIFEATVSNVTMRNIISANHWDAGFDIKASNVLIENAETYGNKNNFKMWGKNITIKSSLSHHAKSQLRAGGTTVEGNGITVESGADVKLLNVTLADNEDHDIRIYSLGVLSLENSIVARHNLNGMLFENDGTGNFTSNRTLWQRDGEDFSNFTPSMTDFWADPLFVNREAGNYHLKETSLAVNYGAASSLSLWDLDLNPRLVGVRSDLGAYEYQDVPSPKFKGISNGDIVKGVIFVQPDRTTFPLLQSVTFSLNGGSSYTTKSNPYTWGGSKGFDTRKLPDGTYILTAVFKISKTTSQTFSVAFTVENDTLLTAFVPAATPLVTAGSNATVNTDSGRPDKRKVKKRKK